MKWWSKIEQNFYSCSRFWNIPDYYTKWQLWNLYEIIQAALDRREIPRKLWQLCSKAALNQGALAQLWPVCPIWQLWKQLRPYSSASSRIALTQLRSSVRPTWFTNISGYTQFWQLWNIAHLHAIFNFVLPNEKQIWQISCQILYTLTKWINK